MEAVALHLDLDPTVARERVAEQAAMLGQSAHIPVAPELPQHPRRALDVREEEGDGSPGERHGRVRTLRHEHNAAKGREAALDGRVASVRYIWRMASMEKTTLYLPLDLQRALQAEARRSGRPQAELVREALRDYLAARPRPRPRSVGLGESGQLDAANSEAWLRDEWARR
jgi:hypothetical protein